MKPVMDLTQKSIQAFKWNATTSEAIRRVKQCFISEPLLC